VSFCSLYVCRYILGPSEAILTVCIYMRVWEHQVVDCIVRLGSLSVWTEWPDCSVFHNARCHDLRLGLVG
jgi:hypothetical protein